MIIVNTDSHGVVQGMYSNHAPKDAYLFPDFPVGSSVYEHLNISIEDFNRLEEAGAGVSRDFPQIGKCAVFKFNVPNREGLFFLLMPEKIYEATADYYLTFLEALKDLPNMSMLVFDEKLIVTHVFGRSFLFKNGVDVGDLSTSGTPIHEIFENHTGRMTTFCESVLSGDVTSLVYDMLTDNHLELTGFPVRDSNDEVVGGAIAAYDVTKKVAIEKENRLIKNEIQSIIDHSSTVILLAEHDGVILRSNQAYRDMFPESNPVKIYDTPFFNDEHLSDVKHYIASVASSSKHDAEPFRLDAELYVGGSLRYFETNLSTFSHSENGFRILIEAREATERVNLKNNLREFKDLSNRFLQLVPMPVIIVNRNTEKIVFHNGKFVASQMGKGDFVGEPASALFQSEEDVDKFRKKLVDQGSLYAEAVKAKTFYGREYDSVVWVEPIEYAGSPSWIAVWVDNTKQSEHIKEMEAVLSNLKVANAELEQFAYVASHDLKEPLRMISQFVQFLVKRNHDSLDSKSIEFVEFILEGTSRMQSLLDGLLTYSRTGRFYNPSVVAFQDIIKGAMVSILGEIRDKKAEVVFPEAVFDIFCDKSQLISVFQNIILNAVKFNQSDVPRVEIKAEERVDDYMFKVIDNGIGIPEEKRDKIFIIFQRLHLRQEYDGTGMGLAISKRIIVNHGGDINVESNDQGGSTFWFTIPKRTGRKF